MRLYEHTCKQCGKKFINRRSPNNKDVPRYCNLQCYWDSKRGKPFYDPTGCIPWNKNTETIACELCGKQIELSPSHAKTRRYCSKDCADEARRHITGPEHPLWKRVKMACEQCGKKVWVKPAKVHEFRFCSRQCHGAHMSLIMAQRNGPTPIEQLMMDELDRRKISYCSQHPIAHWVIDITLPQYRIAIECDGDYWHSSPEQQEKDANKDRWLQAHKWTMFRFLGSEINESPAACVDQIVTYLNSHFTN